MPDGSARGTMAGTLSAVAYSMEVHSDSCTVRTKTKKSRLSEQKNILSGQVGKGVGSSWITDPLFLPNSDRREVSRMSDSDTIFILTKEDVIGEAKEMGIPEEAITDDVLYKVKKGVEWGLECWTEVVKTALDEAMKS